MKPAPTFKAGECRWTKAGVGWVIIEERPHSDGQPAYVRARSDAGRESTFHWYEWAQLRGTP
jgi:hypothetical protein